MPKLQFGQRAIFVCFLCSVGACTTAPKPTKKQRAPRGFIQVNVQPNTTHIYVDDRYQGEIKGWMHKTVPVAPGTRRIELKAAGYITQRFDLTVREGELLTLTLRLERQLNEVVLPTRKKTRRKRRWNRPQ